ncbi:MAG TPA: adenylate/guanylate cyclase domain-containing protein [Anaerolineaceae bacterium]|nr:adenylate/guanylate cyclase domain-containing protein [Anaerolineaceae bacterium]
MTLQQQLDLVRKLDHIFDQDQDESSLALNLASLLSEALPADLVLVALPDQENGPKIHPAAVIDRSQTLSLLAEGIVDDLLAGLVRLPPGDLLHRRVKLPSGNLYLAGVPVHILSGLTGGILIASGQKDFSRSSLSMLQMAASQFDNALRLSRSMRMVRQESLALRTVLKMDRIRDTSASLDDLLDRALAELCRVIPAQVGFIMLYDRGGRRLEMRAVTDQSFFGLANTQRELFAAADEAIQKGHGVHRQYPSGPIHALLGIPLILNKREIGVLGVVNRDQEKDFTQGDRQLMQSIASQMDTAIFERLQTQRLRDTFERNIGPMVMERLLQIEDRDLLKAERIDISALFSDIRGFTAASEHLDPNRLEIMIDQHLDAMARVVLKNEGTLDKFLGDGVMAFFNAPVRQPDHPLRAVQTALEMQQAQKTVIQAWQENGLQPLPIGIGIATGEAMVGNFGSTAHAEYSAIGSQINLASRLCHVAGGGQILIDEGTYRAVSAQVRTQSLPPMELKGFSQPVPVWEVLG